jgi:hypothetical protein
MHHRQGYCSYGGDVGSRRRISKVGQGMIPNIHPNNSAWPLKMGTIGYSETSVRNRYITLLKIPKERNVITGGRILKSLSDISFLNIIVLFRQ